MKMSGQRDHNSDPSLTNQYFHVGKYSDSPEITPEIVYKTDKYYVRNILNCPRRKIHWIEKLRSKFLSLIRRDKNLQHYGKIRKNSLTYFISQKINDLIMRKHFDFHPNCSSEVSVYKYYDPIEVPSLYGEFHPNIYDNFIDYFIRFIFSIRFSIPFVDYYSESVRDNIHDPINVNGAGIFYYNSPILLNQSYEELKNYTKLDFTPENIMKILLTSFNYFRYVQKFDYINNCVNVKTFDISEKLTRITQYVTYKFEKCLSPELLRLKFPYFKENFINGFCDIIIDDEMIDYRSALSFHFRNKDTGRFYGSEYRDWFNLIISASFIRKYYNIPINKITIFNPFEGIEISKDISEWDGDEGVLDMIHEVLE